MSPACKFCWFAYISYISSLIPRITSYNVCYTKLLRIVKVSGTYAVRTGDLNACLSDWSEPVIVEAKTHVDKPEITLSGATEFCDGGALTLTGPEGFSSYLWSNGESTREITVTTSGKYSLTVTNDLGFESEPSRITSYNVCYTKLLRSGEYGRPHRFVGRTRS